MADKKKLRDFHSDLLKCGSTKGFKYFATHLRGREEMICSVINEPSVPIILSASNSPASSFSFRSSKDALPKEPGTVVMSHKQQRRLSGYGFINVGLPPASPSGSEEDMDENSTMFLIAAYGRYNRPYVWVRSNHERVVRLSSEEGAEKDYPLLLKSTSTWHESDNKVWDIIAELVEVSTCPSPPNPFAVDFDYFDALHLPERALMSGAMAHFLQRIIGTGPHPYDRKVQSDLLRISQCHFQAICQLLQDGSIHPPPPDPAPNSPTHQMPRPLSATSSPVKRPSVGQLSPSPPITSHTSPPSTSSHIHTPSPPHQQYYHGNQPRDPMPPQLGVVSGAGGLGRMPGAPQQPPAAHMTTPPPPQGQQQQGMFYSGRASSYQY